MKIYIKQDTINSNALWLVIERESTKANLTPLMGLARDEDYAGNIAFPFLDDELEGVSIAIKKYLSTTKNKKNKKAGK